MNIYLDIDGVIVTKYGDSANHVEEFLKYMTDNHTCYWLTTHCRGRESGAMTHLLPRLSPQVLVYASKVLPTD